MNRRNFLGSLIAIPAGVAAAVKAKSAAPHVTTTWTPHPPFLWDGANLIELSSDGMNVFANFNKTKIQLT